MCLFAPVAHAADWPAWRCTPNHGAVSPSPLPDKLQLLWSRDYPRLEPAWPDQPRVWFDRAYSPVVAGKMLFFGSSADDRLTALDTDTGREHWSFYADGPIRLAPAVADNKVYFASDDGFLYCLDAARGSLLWKFRGGPSDRKLLGNGRLVSAWPARGAPVLADGRVYFAAGFWPFMGIFIYALDAESGKAVWQNDTAGAMFSLRPHVSPAYDGLAPQGYITVAGNLLLIPNGRSSVACLDRETGKFLYHNATEVGNYHLAAAGRFYFNAGNLYEAATGRALPFSATHALALDADNVYAAGAYYLRGYDLAAARVKYATVKGVREASVDLPRLWRSSLPYNVAALIKAGQRLYAAGPGRIDALDLAGVDEAKPAWHLEVEGSPAELLAADGKLFATTFEGRIYCFAPTAATVAVDPPSAATDPPKDDWSARAAAMLRTTGVRDGYALVLDSDSGRLAEELARQSGLHVVAVASDAARLDAFRRRTDAAGLYGRRLAALCARPASLTLPLYFASLITCENPDALAAPQLIEKVFASLRPYGGVLCAPADSDAARRFAALVADGKLPGAQTRSADGLALLIRAGALPGSADWTHHSADATNTNASADTLVRAPLGLLWFGGSTNTDVLPRHGHGPVPAVVAGRVFIEGRDMLRALDAYTGRVLWQAALPGVGAAFDNLDHQVGANAAGSNYVALEDAVYVIHNARCLKLDPATGRTVAEFTLPRPPGAASDPDWGAIRVLGDALIAAADPITVSSLFAEKNLSKEVPGLELDGTSSERLVALNRRTGATLWQRTAQHGFIHNAVAAGSGKVFCIDRPRIPQGILPDAEQTEDRTVAGSSLAALDAATGNVIWSTGKNVFGTWLGYSAQHDVLIQAGRASRDMVWDEPNSRIIAYRGSTGKVLWDKQVLYDGPAILVGDSVIVQKKAYDLLTGARKMRKHPLTGLDVSWGFIRNYGCATPIGSTNLLTFRSAAAGFFDLTLDGGSANLGGFKSGCTPNLIPADGILSAPDYTRTCACGYANQASLALVPMPDAELWAFSELTWDGSPIRRLGVNLGAPGSRRADDGTLWLEYPRVGGPSPDVPVLVAPDRVTWFRKHQSRVQAGPLPWVAASGCKRISRLTVTLASDAPAPPEPVVEGKPPAGSARTPPPPPPPRKPVAERTYTVRLHFAELDNLRPGDRVFDVALQGRNVLRGLDVVREAGGPDRGIVKEFKGIRVRDVLTISLGATPESRTDEPILSGVEVLAEGW